MRATPGAASVGLGAGVASEATRRLFGLPLGVCRRRPLGGRGLRRVDADELALPALVLELDHAVDEREQRIVLAAADAFVKVGSQVEPDSVVCIIEAMKLMNEIQAETAGTVAKIYVENGQPVEYGQPLFGVKK